MTRNSQEKGIITFLFQLQLAAFVISGSLIESNGQKKNGGKCFSFKTFRITIYNYCFINT